ncbi:MAG: hypothetical protein PUE35_05335 [Bacteroidales bacterium]|nr:hypothetical protein [Bacteroidales bacterium]
MKNLFSKLMMVLLIALFALPAQAKFYATGDANYATATGATAWGGSPNAFELNEVSADSHYTLIMNVTDALAKKDITLRLSTSNSSTWDTTNGDTSGFNNNAWGIASGTTNQIIENTTHPIKKCGTNGTNLKFTPSSTGKYILDITDVNMTAGTANVKVYKEPDLPENLYIGMNISSSDWTFGTKMESKGNGVFEYTFTNDKNPFYFLISAASTNTPTWTDSEKAKFYSPGSADYEITTANGRMNAAQIVKKNNGGNVFKMTEDGTYKVTVNLTDATNGTVTVSPVQETSTNTYSIKGTIDGSDWGTQAMTKKNGVWEWTATVKAGSFGIQKLDKNGNQVNWIWSADKASISAAGVYNAVIQNGNNGANWSSTLAGEYTFSFNPETMKLTISGGSSIPTVSYRLKYTEDNWSNSKYSKPLTDNGNGTYGYTFTNPVEGLQFMVQRSTDNGKSYLDFCWPDANDKKYTGGEKTFTMSGAFGNNVTFGAGLKGDYTLTFTPNTPATASTLTIKGTAVAAFDDVYLRGSDPLSWSENKAEYKFSTTDGKIYTLTGVNLNSGVTMKVYKKGTWYGYDADKISGPVKQASSDNNIELTEALSDATITFDITNAENWKLTIVNPKSAYLRGDFTDPNWTDKDEYKFSTTDNQIYVLEHVNIANGKLMKVYYGGNYYGHDKNKVTGPVIAENDNQSGYNMKLTEELKDATITFDITDAVNWKLTIVNGGAVEHKAYYFAGDMNRWYSKKFDGDETASGIDPDIFAAEKDKWQFEYVGEVAGQTEKGWYKYVFDKEKVGMSTLVGQFQIIDDSGWSGSQYSNNPKVENYSDASGFARYNCRPITRKMINERTVMTKETSEGMPGIIQQAGSNFHLDCNGVNDAVIYFLPGENPKMYITGHPTDYFIFYSASGKTGGDDAVSIKIVNGKPNTTNYYLPGVEGLKNYTTEDAQTIAPHMNIEAVTPTLIDFSDANFVSDDNYNKVFGNSGYVGDLTKEEFQNKIINDSQLPNGISLTDRGKVYVAKVPNGFEYAAGRKFAVTFKEAFSQSEKETSSSIVANHLYFFNDNLHVLLNVDEYEAGAENEDAYVKLYYRVYGYDSEYNTIVVKSDGTTETLYAKNVVIGLTEKGNDTQKNAGWVEYNNYKVPSLTSYTGSDKWHYVTDANNDFLGIDPKYGNFFVQFKIVTGPKSAQGAANGPAKAVDKEYTLYLPEKTLALNQEGFYNFNGQDIYQKFDGGYTTTGVEDVFEDQIVEEGVDAEPIFFNLQGQRVVNPEKGMYIVVKGNKTYKVMIK